MLLLLYSSTSPFCLFLFVFVSSEHIMKEEIIPVNSRVTV
ncbi:hypothetical protein HMPREF1348_00274 [Enterococcus faecium 505]|uniref:Uncharacterized protein n=1 Tax=Enterococcus faecium 505 TaxID=1134806 RepID=J7CY87_ENTFC|nr:hypothetical protein HMPREF1348_00274 [Enterococcus faecium 505]